MTVVITHRQMITSSLEMWIRHKSPSYLALLGDYYRGATMLYFICLAMNLNFFYLLSKNSFDWWNELCPSHLALLFFGWKSVEKEITLKNKTKEQENNRNKWLRWRDKWRNVVLPFSHIKCTYNSWTSYAQSWKSTSQTLRILTRVQGAVDMYKVPNCIEPLNERALSITRY